MRLTIRENKEQVGNYVSTLSYLPGPARGPSPETSGKAYTADCRLHHPQDQPLFPISGPPVLCAGSANRLEPSASVQAHCAGLQ
jgi:hypothetical protein